jgi:hypothetical protein
MIQKDASAERVSLLLRALQQGARSTDELLEALAVSQPTLSRTIQAAGADVVGFRLPGVRTPRYARLRDIGAGLAPRQPLYRVSAEGVVAEVGAVSFLAGGGTLVDSEPLGRRTHEGLPPEMAFAAPSGFLGRQAAQQFAEATGVPATLRDWSDDHRIRFLCTVGDDVPGNLIWGAKSLARHLEHRRAAPIPVRRLHDAYLRTASAALQIGHGSSAGGEQPKFACEAERRGHLIVKFARAGSRSADLLVLEELALASLGAAGVAVAAARVVDVDALRFLEVERFDRVGRFGRLPVISAGALDDELFGHRDRWPAFAQRCVEQRLLGPEARDAILLLSAYAELIGNTDTHFENLSLTLDERGRTSGVAPAYDMLPMRYAPLGGGLDPALTPVAPAIEHIGARQDIWQRAFEAASRFWSLAGDDARLTRPMREIARANRPAIETCVGAVLPPATLKAAAASPPHPARSGRARRR